MPPVTGSETGFHRRNSPVAGFLNLHGAVSVPMRRLAAGLFLAGIATGLAAAGAPPPIEVHDRIASEAAAERRVALTLDACEGGFDAELVDFLIRTRIPATIFATHRWLARNPAGLAVLKAHLDLFELEDHGDRHVPAVIGPGRTVYGIPGEPDIVHLRREVLGGAQAVEQATGVAPRWYRGATAQYDEQAIGEIGRMGFGIAGFSVNADAGATLPRTAIEDRMRHVRGGDVILAHMNRPSSDTAEGLRPALLELLRRGFVFVRLDQVALQRTR